MAKVKVKVKCDYCGIDTETTNQNFKKYKKHFCCNEHFRLWQQENKKRITASCLNCGKDVEVYLCHIGRGQGKFCSTKCSGEYKHETGTEERVCPICGIKTERTKSDPRTHCSAKCAGASKRTKVKKHCLNCGIEIHVVPARIKDDRGDRKSVV